MRSPNELKLEIYDLLDHGYLEDEIAEILDIPEVRVRKIIHDTEKIYEEEMEIPKWHRNLR